MHFNGATLALERAEAGGDTISIPPFHHEVIKVPMTHRQ